MPAAQVMVERLNEYFCRRNIGNLDADLFREGTDVVNLGLKLGIIEEGAQEDIMRAIPSGIREMVRALIRLNLQRETRLGMQFLWAPAYDHELTVWEAPGTAVSPGGISILVKTRYPLDPHPSEIRVGSAA